MSLIFEKIRKLLHEEYNFHYDQIQLETDFEKELGTDSREMLELINDFETIFNIEISFDDIDNFLFSGKTIKVQDVVDYIGEKITGPERLENNKL
jgi:acyl carrier protein